MEDEESGSSSPSSTSSSSKSEFGFGKAAGGKKRRTAAKGKAKPVAKQNPPTPTSAGATPSNLELASGITSPASVKGEKVTAGLMDKAGVCMKSWSRSLLPESGLGP